MSLNNTENSTSSHDIPGHFFTTSETRDKPDSRSTPSSTTSFVGHRTTLPVKQASFINVLIKATDLISELDIDVI